MSARSIAAGVELRRLVTVANRAKVVVRKLALLIGELLEGPEGLRQLLGAEVEAERTSPRGEPGPAGQLAEHDFGPSRMADLRRIDALEVQPVLDDPILMDARRMSEC